MGDVDLTVKAKTEGFPAAKADVAGLRTEAALAGTATENLGGSAVKGEAGLAALQAEIKATAASAATVAPAAAAAATGISLFSRALAVLTGPVGLVILAVTALAANLDKITGALRGAADAMARWIVGVGQGTTVLDEHGKAIEPLTEGYGKAANAADLHARALALMRAGLIPATDDMKRLDAEARVYEAAFHGAATSTEDFAASARLLGINIPKDFDAMKASVDGFLKLYESELANRGPASARIFAQENTTLLDQVASRYVRLGQEIPPEIQKVLDSINKIPTAVAEAAKSDESFKKLSESISDFAAKEATLTKALDDNAKAFAAHAAEIEKDRLTEVAAIQQTTTETIASLQQQVKATEDAHAARLISDTQYNTQINALFAAQAIAKAKAYEEERAINEKARQEQVDLTAKFAEEQAKRTEALSDTIAAEAKAQASLDALNVARFNELQALAASKPALFQAGIDLNLLGEAHDSLTDKTTGTARATGDLASEFSRTAGQAPALAGSIGSVTAQMRALESAARAAAAAIASVTGGGGGGAGPAGVVESGGGAGGAF